MNNLSLGFAILFFFLSFIFYYKLKHFDQTLFTTIGENLVLNDESKDSFKGWQKPPVDIFMKIRLFNITNKDGVLNNKEPFVLEEIGPYTYKEFREKINVTINNEDGTVKYIEKKSWVFVPDLSNGSLDDNITHLNIPLISAYNEIMRLGEDEFMLTYLRSIIEIKEIQMILTHTVDELLFKGYEDPILENANVIGLKVPKKFGFFYDRNNTLSKEFEVNSGLKSLINYGKIVTYDKKTKLDYWKKESCNQLNQSTTGDLNPPFQKEIPDIVKIFADDLCRNLPLKFNGSVSYKCINTNRYVLPSDAFDYEKEPENQCYCLDKKCPYNGIYENPLCTQNSTASISFPHFMYADPKYLEHVKGMNPDKDKHTFYYDIEPVLGLVTKASGKIQVNFKLSKINDSGISLTNFMQENDIVVPFFWVLTEAELSSSIYFGLYIIHNILPNLGRIISSILLLTSMILFCYFIYTKYNRNQKITPKPDKIERQNYTIVSTTGFNQ